jgi:mRNA interferase HigB
MFPHWEHAGLLGSFMIVVGKRLLTEFAERHASARGAIAAWAFEVEAASWQSSFDVKARFASASFVGNDRVIFNLKGNHFRLDTQISYSAQVVLVRRIGTHAEYDSWTF